MFAFGVKADTAWTTAMSAYGPSHQATDFAGVTFYSFTVFYNPRSPGVLCRGDMGTAVRLHRLPTLMAAPTATHAANTSSNSRIKLCDKLTQPVSFLVQCRR